MQGGAHLLAARYVGDDAAQLVAGQELVRRPLREAARERAFEHALESRLVEHRAHVLLEGGARQRALDQPIDGRLVDHVGEQQLHAVTGEDGVGGAHADAVIAGDGEHALERLARERLGGHALDHALLDRRPHDELEQRAADRAQDPVLDGGQQPGLVARAATLGRFGERAPRGGDRGLPAGNGDATADAGDVTHRAHERACDAEADATWGCEVHDSSIPAARAIANHPHRMTIARASRASVDRVVLQRAAAWGPIVRARRAAEAYGRHAGSQFAAAIAYRILFSLVPFVALLATLLPDGARADVVGLAARQVPGRPRSSRASSNRW